MRLEHARGDGEPRSALTRDEAYCNGCSRHERTTSPGIDAARWELTLARFQGAAARLTNGIDRVGGVLRPRRKRSVFVARQIAEAELVHVDERDRVGRERLGVAILAEPRAALVVVIVFGELRAVVILFADDDAIEAEPDEDILEASAGDDEEAVPSQDSVPGLLVVSAGRRRRGHTRYPMHRAVLTLIAHPQELRPARVLDPQAGLYALLLAPSEEQHCNRHPSLHALTLTRGRLTRDRDELSIAGVEPAGDVGLTEAVGVVDWRAGIAMARVPADDRGVEREIAVQTRIGPTGRAMQSDRALATVLGRQ